MPESDALLETLTTRTVSGAEVKFGRFTPRDRAIVLRDLRKKRRAALEANCKASGLPPDQQFAELENFDDQPGYGSSKFLEYLNTPEGQDDVHERALLKLNTPEETQKILGEMILPEGDGLQLAAEICNFVIKNTPAQEGDGSENPTETPGIQGYGATK